MKPILAVEPSQFLVNPSADVASANNLFFPKCYGGEVPNFNLHVSRVFSAVIGDYSNNLFLEKCDNPV